MQFVIKFLFCACRCSSLQDGAIFVFSERVIYCFIGKIFFRRTEAVAWRCSVLNISQNLSENTCIGVLSFSKVEG